jgi:membrane-associated phospholipid phosphatase
MASKKGKSFHNFWDFLAFGISAIFSPYITAAAFILLITYTYAENLKQFLPWMGIAIFFAVIIPGGYVLWLIEKEGLQDIHLSEHEERKIPFMVAAISSTIGAIALAAVHASKPVVVMGVTYAANAITVALLTLVWKISIHNALLSAAVTVIVILFGVQFAWLYLLLIPLAWSRIHRQRHTLTQVVGGSVIAFVVTSLVFWIFGYI